MVFMFNILYYGCFVLYEEILYKLVLNLAFNNPFTFVFSCLFSGLLIGLISIFIPKKVNKFLFPIFNFILCFLYGASLIVRKTFAVTITFETLSMYKQFTTNAFAYTTASVLISNFSVIVLVIFPFILGIVYHKKLTSGYKARYVFICMLVYFLFLVSLKPITYDLYFSNTASVDDFGVLTSLFMGKGDQKVDIEDKEESDSNVTLAANYKRQVSDINFDSLISDNEIISNMNDYFRIQSATYTNAHTGVLKGKNLIYIMAESFDGYLLSEELTPTLYKMVHDSYYFSNYYSPTNLSTIGGEFSLLTGLLPEVGVLNDEWNGNNNTSGHVNYYPYGLGNLFNDLGYKTYAYHDYYYDFQSRDKYLSDIGFDNYKACYNGLEGKMACDIFPTSDNEMIEASIDDYINDDKFMVYYATVSGHGLWGFGYNAMAQRNKELVQDLDYSDTVKAYISANLELEKAMTTLINKLEEAGKLDDTVIVLAADHHPYFMEDEYVEEMAGKELDQFSLYKNNLIIYNSATKHEQIDKVCNTIDVLPTVLNLFGIDYDSRLIVGKDIFSTSEGLVIFADYSWLSDKGKYSSNTDTFESNGEEVSEAYVNRIKKAVNNDYQISINIMVYDYYRYVFDK